MRGERKLSDLRKDRGAVIPAIDRAQLPEVFDLDEKRVERSADEQPAIQSDEDLERVTSDKKPTAPQGLSEEARRQIAPKLKPKEAA
jgi:hypothetical protein